jgi:HTH-type transcriptional regulator/antitoxin HigA
MKDNKPAEVFPPGEFLKEELETRGWTQTDLAEILGRPVRVVNEIISGKRGISPETAKGLGDALGTSPQFWLNLESAYQLSRIGHYDDTVARRSRLRDKAPIRELVRRHWIEHSDNVAVLEQRVLEFFGIDSLEDEPTWAYAARKSTPYDVDTTPAQAAWLCRARQLAPMAPARSFSPNKLNALIPKLRNLLHSAEEIRRVPALFAEAGIRFLVIEPLPRTRIDGASFGLEKTSPVIVLSLRYDRIDYFWYTLMHELGHIKDRIYLKDAPSLDVDMDAKQKPEDEKPGDEKRADQFAAETLIPQGGLDDFVLRVGPLYSARKIRGFASRMNVHPGIIVGQLQYRGEITYAQHRKMLSPVRHIITQVALTDGWGSTLPTGL